ncbi:MAG: class I SAM-dependent methyltransferase [Devosia sp.]
MFAPELADIISGMNPANFGALAQVELEHFWFVPRNRLIVGLAAKYFPEAKRFLEIGCGNGAVLLAMAKARTWERLVGAELHPSGLVFARQRLPPDTEFVQMDAREIPAMGAFDLTGAFDVIEHIAEDEAVLKGMREATQLGGGVIIAVPQHPWLWSAADEMAHHERRYCRGELEKKMQRNGFEVLFSTSYTTVLLPLMTMSRLLSRQSNRIERVNQELLPNRTVNALLKATLNAEVAMTLKGVRWPAGGSRVIVGRAI